MSNKTDGLIKIGVSIGLTAIASFLIMVGVTYGDIQKGKEAYNETRNISTQLAVIRSQLDTMMTEQSESHKEIDTKLDDLLVTKVDKR